MVIADLFSGIFKGRKVLLTGHSGFKGSWLSLILSQLGARVHGYSLIPNTSPSLFELAKIGELVTSTFEDIRNYDQLLKTFQDFQPEIVIHMAAQPLVRKSYKDPRETYEVNVMGTVNVLEACRHTKSVRVILNVTTDKCYENMERLKPYREDEPIGGYDPYSNSKGCSELVTSAFRNSFYNPVVWPEHRVAIASARAGNVIGGGDWAEDRLISDFVRAITSGVQLKIRSPHAIRPWQHVLEPLTGYLTLCEKLFQEGAKFSSAWNFGPDEQDAKSVEWIAQLICRLWGPSASYAIDKDPQPHEATYLKLDSAKAKSQLHWNPRWQVDEALEATIDWTRSYVDGKDARQICLSQINRYYSDKNGI